MDPKLQEIITASTYAVVGDTFAYAKVSEVPSGTHFLVSQDKYEITVVTDEARIGELQLIERNKETYALICLNVSVPFYAVGFLAAVTNSIAERGMNVLVVSTFSKDYILVKKERIGDAISALGTLGLKESSV